MRERLTNVARSLRKRETSSEEKLWRELRNRQMDGWKFKRQAPRGGYVVDILCVDAGLVVEIDGVQHADPANQQRDSDRSGFLQSEQLRVLRVTNSDVLENLGGVLDAIYCALDMRQAPSPGAPRRLRQTALAEQARRPLPEGRGEDTTSGKDCVK